MAPTEEPCRISVGRRRGASTTAGRALPACRSRSGRWQSDHLANCCRQWPDSGDASAWLARRHAAPYGGLGRASFFFFVRRGVSSRTGRGNGLRRPCAGADVGDSAYIVADTGRVVSSGDMEGLAHAIGSLLETPAEGLRILGARARARVAEHFEIGNIVRRYEAFYQDSLPQVGISGDDRGDWIGAVNEFKKDYRGGCASAPRLYSPDCPCHTDMEAVAGYSSPWGHERAGTGTGYVSRTCPARSGAHGNTSGALHQRINPALGAFPWMRRVRQGLPRLVW